MKQRLAVFGVVAATALSLAYFGLIQPTTNSQIVSPKDQLGESNEPIMQAEASDEPIEEPAPTAAELALEQASEEQQEAMDAIAGRESVSVKAAMEDPVIKELTKDVFNVNERDWVPAEHRDENAKADGRDMVVLYVVGSQEVTADYNSGITWKSTGIFNIVAEVKDGQVFSYETIPQPDVVREYKYNSAELAITEKLLLNATIAKIVEDKEWYPLYYGHPRGPEYSFNESIGCIPETCVTVLFRQLQSEKTLLFNYDTASEKIIGLELSGGW